MDYSSVLSGHQFQGLGRTGDDPYTAVPNHEFSHAPDITANNELTRPGSPYHEAISRAMPMHPSMLVGNTWMDEPSLMHPVSPHPNTIQRTTFV